MPPLSRALGALAAAALFAGALAPAHADRLRERAEADSFGNLVVWSRSGYKRIVVGQGDLAADLNAYNAGAPAIVRGDDPYSPDDGGDAVRNERLRRHAYTQDCHRAPAFVKGRGYMYGLAEGEMPVITPCERIED